MEGTNTMVTPLMTPDMDRGKVTRVSTLMGLQPRSLAASNSFGSILLITV